MYLKLYNVDIERNFYYPSAYFSLLLRFLIFLQWPVVPFTQSHHLISSATERQLPISTANA